MRERHTKKFRELQLRYEAMTNREKAETRFFFEELMPQAKNFSDWAVIYSYGDSCVEKDALLKMKENAIRGLSRQEIQLNIMELFLVIDKADMDEILTKYLKRFHKEEDFLFVYDVMDKDNYEFKDYFYYEMEKYGVSVDVSEGEEERLAKLDRLLLSSKFNPLA